MFRRRGAGSRNQPTWPEGDWSQGVRDAMAEITRGVDELLVVHEDGAHLTASAVSASCDCRRDPRIGRT